MSHAGADPTHNVCAGPFGSFYDFYIERPRLMRLVGRTLWGIDASSLYTSMEAIGRAAPGATIVDVPCGGGVAFRGLDSAQDVRYIAADLCPKMLGRAKRRARKHSLDQVELLAADMCALPFADAEVDLFLSYSGLHMVEDAERAVREIGRCLKPGGELVGTTFFADGSRRSRALFALGARRGHALPPRREDLLRWLESAGLTGVEIESQPGFAAFNARKAVEVDGQR